MISKLASPSPAAAKILALRPARRSLLRQQVVEILRDAITECVFAPGGRLIERELGTMLGVSRTTIREGLRQLEAEGLLEITPNKGPMVALLGADEAAAVYALRGELEGYACALCAERATQDELDLLGQSVATMNVVAGAAPDFKALQQAKTEFYGRLYDAARNPELKKILQRLRARVTLIRGLEANREARMSESVQGARSILSELRKRDPAAARKAAQVHMSRAAALALEAMRSPARAEARSTVA